MRKGLHISTFLGIFVFCLSALGFAQQQTITGTVTDAQTGETLPGVNIRVAGTSQGTSSNTNGQYSLTVSSQAEQLVFTFVGYEELRVAIQGRSQINVELQPSVEFLDDVVVTSFGIEQEKKALGYSVQEISAEELAESSESNLVGALQGKVAGVNIKGTSGAAGGGVDIIVRGITSMSPGANNQPLFVVDGIPISNETVAGNVLPSAGSNSPGSAEQFSFSNRAADINPDDIESISILKGPSATALYGLRAANGAVVITTKKGHSGQTQVGFETTVGVETVGKVPEIQDKYLGGRFGALPFTVYDFAFWQYGPPATDNGDGVIYNNFERLFRTGISNTNSLNVSGGSDNATYFSSFSNVNQGGIVPNTEWGRTTFRLGGSINFHEDLTVTGSVNYANSGGIRPTGGDKSIMSSLSYWPSSLDINDYLNEDGTQHNPTAGIIDNPRYFAENSTLEDDVNRIYGNAGFNYNILDWLSLEYKVGIDYYSDRRDRFVPPNLDVGTQVNGFVVEETISSKEINSNLFVRANHEFTDRFRANLLVGNQITDSGFERLHVRGEGLNIPNFRDLSNTTNLFSNKAVSKRRLVGVFGDLQFDYDGTYFLSLTGRNDWSSTLPKENRSFFYPSASFSYIFSETLDLNDNPILNYGKLRFSWAKVGKDAPPFIVGQYFQGDSNFPFNGVGGFRRDTQAGTNQLKPETTTSYEIGTELRLLNNSIGLEATYFMQSSKDQIVDFPVSNPSGLSRFYTNAGEIESNGIELLLTATPVQNRNFSWDVAVNWSKINNEVISMPEGLDIIEFANSGFAGVVSRLEEGGSPGDLYGYTFEYDDQGRMIIEDGFPTIVTDSLVKVGNALPIWEGGITNTFNYEGLSLSFLVEVKHGGDVYDAAQRNSLRNGLLKMTETRNEEVIFNGVKRDGTPNDVPVKIDENFYRNSSTFNRASEILVQDASWLRLRNVSLKYRLPQTMLEKIPVQGLTLSVTGRNLYLNTPYRGYDPEGQQYSAGTNTFGFTGLNIPPTKSVTFGVNVNF